MNDLTIVETKLSRATQDYKAADERRGRVVLGYVVDTLLPAFGLTQWRIWLDLTTAPPVGALASIEADPEDHYAACLRITNDLLELPRERRRITLVHEVIHLRYLVATEYVRKTTRELLAPDAYRVWWAGFVQLLERETDGLATALAPLLPLPDDNFMPRNVQRSPDAIPEDGS